MSSKHKVRERPQRSCVNEVGLRIVKIDLRNRGNRMSAVRAWEETVVIPTYEVGAADKNPMFLEKRVYQGSSGKIYPYPATNDISRIRTDREWHAVYLENDYLKVMILPELGGRIQRAYDKTNGYDFVYYNHVIKPALVGLTGPWISGGIEFNWPQHHRPTTYSPVDHRIVEHDDGSRSVLIGDVDQMYGTKEVMSLTLYPDKAYLEVTGQLYNRTPLPQTFLWWANPAVSVNDHTRSIFPPDVHNVYDHGKRAVSRFPIATGEYYKHDYSEGVDISRYRNIPVPTSYMAEHSEYDFVGGYDDEKQAGLLHVADHHISPGKKQWTWGCGDFGRAWDRNLTDEDGPYIELMTGMYCDNQPDFSWLKPFEEKTFRQYFMPYKAVGQVKNATIHAVLGVEFTDADHVTVRAYATSRYEDARIVLACEGKEIYSEQTLLSPVDVYEREIRAEVPERGKLKVSVYAGTEELVSYQEKEQGIPEIAEPARAAKLPEEILTNEELYLTGQHIEQYRHATWLPDPYYLEGLKRDEGDTRINDAYGLLLLRRGCFEEAERYFRKAIERLTQMHPNPYDSEPFYHLGLSLFCQERYGEAYDAFYKAVWVSELQEMGYYYLAAIDARRGAWTEAREHIDRALVKNSHNIKARGLRAIILCRLGEAEAAGEWIEENLRLDPFDFLSMAVKILFDGAEPERLAAFHALSRDFHETYLQVARDLAESGQYEEALRVLSWFPGDQPMIRYYRGAYQEKLGREAEAREEFAKGERADSAYCFPNKPEDIRVLQAAIRADDTAARAGYYLGCLYYDKLQYDQAAALWRESAKRDDTFPTVFRNLAIVLYNHCGEKEQARTCLERAFALDPSDARVFLELDQLLQRMLVPLEERCERYRANLPLIERRDDLYTEYVTLLNSLGRHEEALQRIEGHTFRTWEGAEGRITAQFKLALLKLAQKRLADGDPAEAASLLKRALSYPENLGEGRLEGTRDNHLYYHLGLAWEALHDDARAKECYEKATEGAMEVAGMLYYYDQPADMILYQGLAYEKLGDRKAANARYYRLLDYGERHVRDTFRMDYFAVSLPDLSVFETDMTAGNTAHCYYVMGLACLGLRDRERAREMFDRTLALDNSHQNAILYRSGD